jgi:hypothetical protein
MNHRLTRIALAAAALSIGGIGAFASTATATFHENLIREAHEGTGSVGDYVELQAFAPGQNEVAGKHIVTYDAGGGVLTDYTIPSSVANGASQATILVANAASVGGVTPDFQAGSMGVGDGNLNVDNTGGTVCYTDSSITVAIDCVAFDRANDPNPFAVASFNPPQFGAPLILPGANLDGQSLIRTISRGCATTLDASDDTNSAADFTLGAGTPRNNSMAPTEAACPPSPTTAAKKKCKKKKKKHSAEAAKKKKCKKKKKKG